MGLLGTNASMGKIVYSDLKPFFFFLLIRSPVKVGEAVPQNTARLGTYLEHTIVHLDVRGLAFPKSPLFSALFLKLDIRLECVVDPGFLNSINVNDVDTVNRQ